MRDDEYLNILTYGKPTGTISIKPHPEDVIDVDPVIIAKMKARLKGEDFNQAYDVTDRFIDELSLQREKNKLKKIFGSELQIRDAYSSIKNIHSIQEEIAFEDIDKRLLSNYALKKSKEKNVDEVDFYHSFLFDRKLTSKEERIIDFKKIHRDESIIQCVFDDYKETHFNFLTISKEAIQLDENLKRLFLERKLASILDIFLKEFYGLRT